MTGESGKTLPQAYVLPKSQSGRTSESSRSLLRCCPAIHCISEIEFIGNSMGLLRSLLQSFPRSLRRVRGRLPLAVLVLVDSSTFPPVHRHVIRRRKDAIQGSHTSEEVTSGGRRESFPRTLRGHKSQNEKGLTAAAY